MMTRYTWADEEEPQPRRRRYDPAHDRNLTFHEGRFFRDERTIRDPDNTVTQAEQRELGQRAREAAEARLAEKDANLAAAVRLGAALKVLRGEE
jgi:hypothetical protein